MTSWFLTKNGRLFTRAIVGAATASVCGTYIAFNGPLLGTYQSFMQMYSNGSPKPLSPELLQTADMVLNDCKEKEKIYIGAENKRIKFFASIGRDLFHAGCTRLPWGAIVGLPFMFGIKDKSDADLLNLKVHRKEKIDWLSEGDELLQSLILSENAQKFAIAREVFACSSQDFVIEPVVLACSILLPARLVQKSNKSGRAFKLPLMRRAAFYAVLYCVSFIIFKCLNDMNRHGIERECDEKAGSLGPEYLEGGIEFYEKTRSKNKALRQLMGSDGERYYNAKGEESHFIFLPHLPVSKHLEILHHMKKQQAEAAS